MGAFIISSPDFGDSPVSGKDNNGCSFILQSPIKETETLNVEHMYFIYKEDPWYNISLALLPPLSNLLVNLVPDLLLDFPRVPCKQGQKPLLSRVDHVYFMEGHSVHHFLPLFYFPLGTLHKTSLGPHGIIVTGSGKGSTYYRYFATGFVNGDHIPCLHFLFLNAFYHFLP